MDRETSLDIRERHEEVCLPCLTIETHRSQARLRIPTEKHVGPFLVESRMCGQSFVTDSMDSQALMEIHDHGCSMINSASQEVSCLSL